MVDLAAADVAVSLDREWRERRCRREEAGEREEISNSRDVGGRGAVRKMEKIFSLVEFMMITRVVTERAAMKRVNDR